MNKDDIGKPCHYCNRIMKAGTLRRYKQAKGIKDIPARIKSPPFDLDEAIKLRKQHYKLIDIARILNVNPRAISRVFIDKGVK